MLKKIVFYITYSFICLIILELISRFLIQHIFKNSINKIQSYYAGATIDLPSLPTKNTDELRIFVFGGSTTEGVHLPKAGYVEQLNVLLTNNLDNKKAKVYNYGFSGFNSSDDRFLIERTLKDKPDAIIVYTSHNEFLRTDSIPYYTYILSKLKSITFLKLLSLVSQKIVNRNSELHVAPIEKDASLYKTKFEIFKDNVNGIAALAKKNKVNLIFITAASNLSDWPPIDESSQLPPPQDNEYKEQIILIKQQIDNRQFDLAEKRINELIPKYPKFATLYWLMGNIELIKKNVQAANTYLRLAKDLDIVPWRALSEYNEYIRSFRNIENIEVIDFEKSIESHSPENLPGFTHIIDNVHLTTKANFILSMKIYETLRSKSILKNAKWKKDEKTFNIDTMVLALELSQSDRYTELLLAAKYTIKPPFYNYTRANTLLTLALEIQRNDWILWANKATSAFGSGQIEDGLNNLKQAVILKNGKISLSDYNNVPSLEYAINNIATVSGSILESYLTE